MKKFVVTALAFVALTSSSFASDMAVKAPPSSIAHIGYNWTGLYVGIEGGWSRINTRWLNTATDIGTPDFDGKGALFGGTLGYNWQPVGTSFVLGVESDWSWANPKAFTLGLGFGCGGAPAGCNTEVSSIGTARARLGFAWGPVLLYGTGVRPSFPPRVGKRRFSPTIKPGLALFTAAASNGHLVRNGA